MEIRIILLLSAAALLLALLEHLRTRRIMHRLERMLDKALEEGAVDESFDESRLSALETRLAHHLAASALSARNLKRERDRIQGLVADISHQTKTPVSNLILYAQLLREQDLPEPARKHTEALERQAVRLQRLIESLVKTSRLESGILTLRPAPGPVQPVVEAALEQAGPAAEEKGVALTAQPSRARARLDPKWTAEALYNLLDNAVKYTPSGGHVEIRVMSCAMFTRIDVRDDGPGIPEEERGRIFQRFYRAPAAAREEGVGIGLYLVRQIAAGQGGYVKVFSQPGKGSVFSLYLPGAE